MKILKEQQQTLSITRQVRVNVVSMTSVCVNLWIYWIYVVIIFHTITGELRSEVGVNFVKVDGAISVLVHGGDKTDLRRIYDLG